MKIKRIPLDKATRDQLAQFAVIMGLEIDKQDAAEIIGMLKAASYTNDFISVQEAAPKPQSSASKDVLQNSQVNVWDGKDQYGIKRARTMIYIRIPNQDRPGGDREVPISVNGTSLFVKRNTPSLVPEEYVEALEHAIENRYDPNPDPERPLSEVRQVERYPFQRVAIVNDEVLVNPRGKPYERCSQSDVDAYKKKRDAAEMAQDKKKREHLERRGLVA